MGLLNALIQSADRFEGELLPVGYAERRVTWIVNIDPAGRAPAVVHKQSPKLAVHGPNTPADRTAAGVSPTLLVDKLSYALNIADHSKKGNPVEIAREEHTAFVGLANRAAATAAAVEPVANWLSDADNVRDARTNVDGKPNDLVVFEVGSRPRVADDPAVRAFWTDYMSDRLGGGTEFCSGCGEVRAIARILPFKVKPLGKPVQLSSVNESAFCSGGHAKASDRQSGLCYRCAGTAKQVLDHLLEMDRDSDDKPKSSGRHAVVLAYDDSPKKTQPTRNQIAVFWTRHPTPPAEKDPPDGPQVGEKLTQITLGSLDSPTDESGLIAREAQLRSLLERPLTVGTGDATLPVNKFHLAVLSPSKGRLIVREWLEEGVEAMRANVKRYLNAARISHPSGRYAGHPPLPALLAALQSPVSARNPGDEKGRLPQAGPDLTRSLLRCMFAGGPPPEALLRRAVRCFRVPDPPAEGKQRERQEFRRMALAAAMKLVLTHDAHSEAERNAMVKRETEHDDRSDYKTQSPYLAGCLLAILEAIQARPGNKVNTTLVDRFYGAASTAPASTFGGLIATATKAHLPKLRKAGKEWFTLRDGKTVNVNDRLAETCAALDGAGGFDQFLEPTEQAQFALGFYAERNHLKPPPKSKQNPDGEGGDSSSDTTTQKDAQ